ncbi:MAG TPA: hypothetical protein VLJ38_10110 [Polyangiaceae bacterium]|nr:hypothetical protein [Polyangiaceae bacterium]
MAASKTECISAKSDVSRVQPWNGRFLKKVSPAGQNIAGHGARPAPEVFFGGEGVMCRAAQREIRRAVIAALRKGFQVVKLEVMRLGAATDASRGVCVCMHGMISARFRRS